MSSIIDKLQELKKQELVIKSKLFTIGTDLGCDYNICYQGHYDKITITIVKNIGKFNSDHIIKTKKIDYHCDITIPLETLQGCISIIEEKLNENS